MINVNQVTLIGTVSCTPVFDTTRGGTPVCKFLMITEDPYNGEKRESTHHISAMGEKLCNIIKARAMVGKAVLVKGRLEYWADDKKQRLVDVRASHVEFDS